MKRALSLINIEVLINKYTLEFLIYRLATITGDDTAAIYNYFKFLQKFKWAIN